MHLTIKCLGSAGFWGFYESLYKAEEVREGEGCKRWGKKGEWEEGVLRNRYMSTGRTGKGASEKENVIS